MLKSQLILKNKCEMVEYAMYGVRLGKCDGYIIYAEARESAAMELVCLSEEKAKALFSGICRCELSPVHLHDVVEDRQGEWSLE